MGRYMTVVLKQRFRNEKFMKTLNELLTTSFGSNAGCKFNTWEHIQEDADYMNNHELGKLQLPHFERPITKEILEKNFFWYRYGEFSFKLSGCSSSDEARDAVAVCKWLLLTCYKYISKQESENFSVKVLREYLDDLFIEAGYDMKKLWSLPSEITDLNQHK